MNSLPRQSWMQQFLQPGLLRPSTSASDLSGKNRQIKQHLLIIRQWKKCSTKAASSCRNSPESRRWLGNGIPHGSKDDACLSEEWCRTGSHTPHQDDGQDQEDGSRRSGKENRTGKRKVILVNKKGRLFRALLFIIYSDYFNPSSSLCSVMPSMQACMTTFWSRPSISKPFLMT